MELVFLGLDFLCPLFFFILGRSLKGENRRILVRESLLTFTLALFLAPAAFLWGKLVVQGVVCAGILCTQFILLAKASARYTDEKKIRRS